MTSNTNSNLNKNNNNNNNNNSMNSDLKMQNTLNNNNISMNAKCMPVMSEAPAFASSLTRSSISPFSSSTGSYEVNPIPPPRRLPPATAPRNQPPAPASIVTSSTPKSYLSQSQYSLSQSSYILEDDAWYSQLFLNRMQTTPTLFSPQTRKIKRSSTFNSDDLTVQTPSPSDSGITDLEALLREKDSEISFLRETLEQNEQVIFKVYEEKEQSWQKEYMRLRTQYESSLLLYQKKALQAEEQLLRMTQQEKEAKARNEKEVHDLKNSNLFLEKKIAEMSLEIDSLRDRLTESDWSLCQKTEELVSIRNAESGGGRDSCSLDRGSIRKRGDVESEERQLETAGNLRKELQGAIKVLQDQVHDLQQESKSSESTIARLRQENQDLRYELGNVREELNTSREGFAEEKDQWQEEKQKVILYQKQLNHNLILVLKRNKEIESELKALKEKTPYKIITDETKC